jgi:uncharacterized Zn finger protein
MAELTCPVCGRTTVEQLLREVQISAKVDGETPVGGLQMYRCTELGHIFFVRARDIEESAAA